MDQNSRKSPGSTFHKLSEGRGQLQLLSVRNSFTVPTPLSSEALIFSLIKHFCHPLYWSLPKPHPIALIKLCAQMPGTVVGAVTGNPRASEISCKALKLLLTNLAVSSASGCGSEFASRDDFPSNFPSLSNKQLDSWKQKRLAGLLLEASAVLSTEGL